MGILNDFKTYQAQTSTHPLSIAVSHAKGSYIFDTDGKQYLDFVAGVSACSLGHQHPRVVSAIKKQVDTYLHVMVYGEFAQQPATELCKLLAKYLPKSLQKTYLTNSGTEAIEGAIKLAKRATGKQDVIAAKHAYHGNTIGALSIMGFEHRKQAFRPLVPGSKFITYNNFADLDNINNQTACVVLETIQGGAGFIEPESDYLKAVKEKCQKVGALLILDEIQTGIGRTGKLFGFENYNCIPDILVSGKGLGGGLPIGAFTASEKLMTLLSTNPELGHITTFGGNPVIAASALATLKEITETNLINETLAKEQLIRTLLQHNLITEIRGKGLMLAAILQSEDLATKVILKCKDKGLILFWLLFEKCAIRLTPPLTITNEELIEGCGIIIDVLNSVEAD